MTSSSGGRDYFTISEGVHKSKAFSVLAGNLSTEKPAYKSAANLVFSIGRKILTYQVGSIKAFVHPAKPIAHGTHPIQIPDHPHSGGGYYAAISPHAKSWFYLGHGEAIAGSGDRYLHPGNASAGCITVDPIGWTQLYRYLILCRSGNGKTIGTVAVVR